MDFHSHQLNNMKVFKDPIHGSISLPDYCVEVIDTPQFQRLRRIKQLTAETVYPGATHNRFAHSIGVCYLAGKVIKHLKENQTDLDITDHEVKCVQLAGLCHDLGHGPFSHKFEYIVKRLLRERKPWKHEEASVEMLRHLSDDPENKIKLEKGELDLISDLISGKPPQDNPEKRFLYQIVANKDNGIDVDKWDYFARDCHYLGVRNSFDHDRIIPFMRVCRCENKKLNESGEEMVAEATKEICFRDKLMQDLSAMFAVRWDLHYRAYQHRVVKLVEEMYADALHEYFTEDAKKESPEFGPMKKVIRDMSIYSKLDDQIVGTIVRSKNPELDTARKILHRIQTRDLYQCIGEILDADRKNVPKDDEIRTLLTEDGRLKKYFNFNKEDLVIINHKYDYGMKDKNPLKHIRFFEKDKNTEGIFFRSDEKMPPTLPAKIQLRDVRMYTKARVPQESLSDIQKTVVKIILTRQVTPTKKRGPSTPPHAPEKTENPRSEAYAGSPHVVRSLGKRLGNSS